MKRIVITILLTVLLSASCSSISPSPPNEKSPKNVIPLFVAGFTFIEKSDRVNMSFDGVEYWAYSLFQPRVDSPFSDKVLNLEIRVHKCSDETSAEKVFSMFTGAGTIQEEISVGTTRVTLCYDEDYGEATVVWQDGNLVIFSDAIPPFEAIVFDQQALKDAAVEGAKATMKNL